MSATGVGPFENDFALDLCDEIRYAEDSEIPVLIAEALSAAADVPADNYVERDLAETAVAAAAIALAISKNKVEVLRETEISEQTATVPSTVFPLIVAALNRVLAEDSEIRVLWTEAGGREQWENEVRTLLGEANEHITSNLDDP